MATKKFINLTAEAKKEEELDLTLRLGKDKGKRPIEGSLEKDKKRKRHNEELKEANTDRFSEDKVAHLEKEIEHLKKMIEDLEKLSKRQDAAIAAKIERYFFWSTQCFCKQQQKSIDCMTAIYTSLYDIAQSLKPKDGSEMVLQFTTPKPEGPSTSKKPLRQ